MSSNLKMFTFNNLYFIHCLNVSDSLIKPLINILLSIDVINLL